MRAIGIILVVFGATVASYGSWMKWEYNLIVETADSPRAFAPPWHARTVLVRLMEAEAKQLPGGGEHAAPAALGDGVERFILVTNLSGGGIAAVGVVVALLGWRKKFEADAMRRVRAMSMSEDPPQ